MATSVGLTDIDEFVILQDVVDLTLDVVAAAGREGYEAFVLWGGERTSQSGQMILKAAYEPKQRRISNRDGLLVVVDGAALHRANTAFYENGLVLAAQAHSHPSEAYHSATDDDFPLMTLIGGLSIVIPDFGRGGRQAVDDWAWYRLVDVGRWQPIGADTRIVIST
jgi:hypothetical protein